MASEVNAPWPVEDIPNGDTLYMRVHKNNILNGELDAAAFQRHGGGLSTDWAKYASPEDTRSRSQSSPPGRNAVVAFVVGDIRDIGFDVAHEPIMPTLDDPFGNQAHTEVSAQVSSVEFRAKLSNLWKPEIPKERDDLMSFGRVV